MTWAPLYHNNYDWWKGWDSLSDWVRPCSKTKLRICRDGMSTHTLDWLGGIREGIDRHSTQHDFLSNSDTPLCPCDLDFFFLWNFEAFPYPSCSCTLCHALSCILPDGLGHSLHSCWQTPGKCHTQLPAFSVLPWGGWWLFLYFCLV